MGIQGGLNTRKVQEFRKDLVRWENKREYNGGADKRRKQKVDYWCKGMQKGRKSQEDGVEKQGEEIIKKNYKYIHTYIWKLHQETCYCVI